MIQDENQIQCDEIGLAIEVAIIEALEEFVTKYPNPNGYTRKVFKCNIPESPTLIVMMHIFDKDAVIRSYEFYMRETLV